MDSMLLDLAQKGLRVAFPQDWQVEVMEAIWSTGSMTSAQAFHIAVNFGAKVSRTSVIYFLNKMVEENILLSEPLISEGHLQFLYKTKTLVMATDGIAHASPEAFKAHLFFELSRALAEVTESG